MKRYTLYIAEATLFISLCFISYINNKFLYEVTGRLFYVLLVSCGLIVLINNIYKKNKKK